LHILASGFFPASAASFEKNRKSNAGLVSFASWVILLWCASIEIGSDEQLERDARPCQSYAQLAFVSQKPQGWIIFLHYQ
jgi:hypothetical protein